jgi:hypothetical protein
MLGTKFDKRSQIMTHADDVVVMGWRLKDVEEVFTWLAEQTNTMGLGMNGRKPKFMIFSRKDLQQNRICRTGY